MGSSKEWDCHRNGVVKGTESSKEWDCHRNGVVKGMGSLKEWGRQRKGLPEESGLMMCICKLIFLDIQNIFPWDGHLAPGWKAYVPGRYAETKPRLKDTSSLSQALPRLDAQPREEVIPKTGS